MTTCCDGPLRHLGIHDGACGEPVVLEFDTPARRDEAIRWADAFRLPWTLTAARREDWTAGDGDTTYPVWTLTINQGAT